jgi:hypothetical protein
MKKHRVARLVLLSWVVAAWGMINPCAAQEVNVLLCGAEGDGKTDDLEAFNKAIAAAADKPHCFARRVRVPKGTYRLNGNLIIDRTVELIGDGPGFAGGGGSELQFEPGYGIINTAYCAIRDLRITGEPVPGLLRPASEWKKNWHYYPKGVDSRGVEHPAADVVRPPNDNRYYFECIREGTSGASAPEKWGPIAHIPSYTTLWKAGEEYKTGPLGSVVRRDGDFDRIFECINPGTSGSSPPPWKLTFGTRRDEEGGNQASVTEDGPNLRWGTRDASNYFTVDGDRDRGAIWEAKVHAGVHMRNGCEVSNCFITNFSNAGIHIQGAFWYAPPRNCNLWYLSRDHISFCGLGVAIAGDDSNVGNSQGLDIIHAGETWTHRLTAEGKDAGVLGAIPGTGGVGIYDHSDLGCTHVGAHVASTSGAAYIADDSNARSVFLGCYAETATPNKVTANNIVVGGHQPNNFTADSTGPRFSSDWMNLLIVDRRTVTTKDANAIVLHRFALEDKATTQVDVTVTAFQNAGPGSPDGATFVLRGAWFNAGGTIKELKPPTQMDRNPQKDPTRPHIPSDDWKAYLQLDGPTVHLYVKGDGNEIKWESVYNPNLNFNLRLVPRFPPN